MAASQDPLGDATGTHLSFPPVEDLPRRIPWIHQVVPGYCAAGPWRWIRRNMVSHNNDTGITIRYRFRRPDDVICGARTLHPGHTQGRGSERDPWEAVCSIVGDHAEIPHVGVPAACADMTCRCRTAHLVIEGLSIQRPAVSR